jgi:hypothetical protein
MASIRLHLGHFVEKTVENTVKFHIRGLFQKEHQSPLFGVKLFHTGMRVMSGDMVTKQCLILEAWGG